MKVDEEFSVLDLLKHLWPDFSALSAGTTNGLSALFWIVMVAIFALAVFMLLRHLQHFRARMKALRGLTQGQTKEHLAQNRREMLQNAELAHPAEIGKLWREFDESLVISSDRKQLFNTLDAEHFFNARSLAAGLTASRLLAATPSFLVAIGVLGTFVGLTVGLESLNLDSHSEVDELRDGIDGLIRGAAVAFMTSVWGVGLSLLLNVTEKFFERKALSEIAALQRRIDYLYPRIPAEQSLVEIADSSRESKEALQELHERIGDRLQETITGMSEGMQQALSDTLNRIMAPAIEALVSTASQHSTKALERLVTDFMSGVRSAGREQGDTMSKAAQEVNTAVTNMSERMDKLFSSLAEQQEHHLQGARDHTQRFDAHLESISRSADDRQKHLEQRFGELMADLSGQLSRQFAAAAQQDVDRQTRLHETLKRTDEHHRERLAAVDAHQQDLLAGIAKAVETNRHQNQQLAEQHRQILASLQNAAEMVVSSSKHLDSSASQLGLLSSQIRHTADLLGQRLDSLAQKIEVAAAQNAGVAEQVSSQATMLGQLQAALLDAAQRFEQAAIQARGGFGEMKLHQEAFLSGVRQEFTSLGEILRQQVEGIEKQAEAWLRSYSEEVKQQIEERMMKWNEVSHAYADQMLNVVTAVANVVDELEKT